MTQNPDGVEYSCGPGGLLEIPLPATALSRMAGQVHVSGPFAIWIVASTWECEVIVGLERAFHSCAVAVNGSTTTWTTNFTTAATVDLSSLPIDLTAGTGLVPPGDWTLLVVDSTSSNETASVVAPVVLDSP